MKRCTALFLAILMVLSLVACAKPEGQEPNDDKAIDLLGLSAEPEQLTIAALKELDNCSGEANTINSANEATCRSYTGARVEKILAHFGKNLKDFAAIVVNAGDGYAVEIPREILDSRDIILAWELDGAPLAEKDAPLRVVVPEERTLYWVRNVASLEFVTAPATVEVREIVFFENLLPQLTAESYTYYGSEDKAVNITQLVGEGSQVTLVAVDGLTKYENLKPDIDYFIKVDGEDAPQFISPDIPKGMYVKFLGFLIDGSKAIVFANSFSGDKDKVDMHAVQGLLAPYLGEQALTLALPGGNLTVTPAELGKLALIIGDLGVGLE
jgi:hypothetical protein